MIISSGPAAICGSAIKLAFGLLGLLILLKKSAVFIPSNSSRTFQGCNSGLPTALYNDGIRAGGVLCAVANPIAMTNRKSSNATFRILIHFLLKLYPDDSGWPLRNGSQGGWTWADRDQTSCDIAYLYTLQCICSQQQILIPKPVVTALKPNLSREKDTDIPLTANVELYHETC